MLNSNKIVLMTKMAAYENKMEKKNVSIENYFKGDYISLQVMKAIINGTVAFILCFCLFVLYDFEIFIEDLYQIDLLEFFKQIILVYTVFIGSYTILSYLVYIYRYGRAKNGLKHYYNNLQTLERLYLKEDQKKKDPERN